MTLIPWVSEAGHATSVTLVPHNTESFPVRGEDTFTLKLEGQCWVRTRDLQLSKQATLTTTPGPPPSMEGEMYTNLDNF